MSDRLSLTAVERVLLHLKDHWLQGTAREYPVPLTQKGISEGTGLRLSHVPRATKKLVEAGLATELKAHVKGERRRYKVFILTDAGLDEARRVLAGLGGCIVEHDEREIRLADLLEAERPARYLEFIRRLMGEDTGECTAGMGTLAGDIPDTGGFVDRAEEMDSLRGMLADPENRVMVIYGSRGYGTSTLAAMLLREAAGKGWSGAWIPMARELDEFLARAGSILAGITGGPVELDREPETLVGMLGRKRIILALDDYAGAGDDLVEYLTGLVAALKDARGPKLLMTARESIPSYERFYTILDIHDGTVGEVHVRGLDMEHCRDVLGTPDIDPEALRRLWMFTMGQPHTLKLLATGDEALLQRETRFSPEEIKLMLFLMEQKSDG